jgi:beta-glucosidase
MSKGNVLKSPGRFLLCLSLCSVFVACVAASLYVNLLPVAWAQDERAAYRDARLAVDERVRDLLGRMTVEEKVAQLTCLWARKPQERDEPGNYSFPDRGGFSAEKARRVMSQGIGEIARQREGKDARASAEYANAVQRWLAENTRLRIPAIFHDEALHGHMARGSTVFPVPLALAASWDTELVSRVFTVAALETRARGGQQVLGPNLDLAREPRWGRTEETYGEDPYLAARMGVAVVRALQGNSTLERPAIDAAHVIATGKHFAGHGQPEGGTNIAPVNLSERLLRETHFETFEAAVKEANLQAVMPAYHEIDGVPVHANSFMLEEVLRGEWGFKGLVVSDYDGVAQLASRHHVAADKADAARQALEAGVDVELPDPDAYATIVEQVKAGKIPEATLDRAVGRVLRAKFLLGLFENPYVNPQRAAEVTDSAEHRALAAEAARRSIILLKNEGSVLPFDRTRLKSVAVIGPNAAGTHMGGYTDPQPPKGLSILEGVRAKVGSGVRVNYAEGCKITKEGGNWFGDTATPNDEADDRRLIAEAVEAAKASDAVVLVIGGNEDTNREAWAENHLGDRDSLELVGRQNELVRAVLATNRPTAVFLINGGPLSINYVAANAPAILEGFYLGEETGTAAADVLFGDYNPAGKLPVTFPRSVGQLPAYYNRKPSAKRGYLFTKTEPLFPFGYGLSYTTFAYTDLRVSPARIRADGEATVRVSVTNKGRRRGDEVVQLYIRDEVSSVTRPVKELKDFARVTLEPGETRQVSFRVTPDKLWFFDRQMRRVVEPGTFQLMVGASSVDLKTVQLEVVDR